MRITGDELVRAGQVSGTPSLTPATPATEGASAATSDTTPAATVTLSAKAQEINQVKATVNALPDVREDVVASLKQRIDSGEYKVNSADVADMMLRRHAADQIR